MSIQDTDKHNGKYMLHDGPVHQYFGLSYDSFKILHRSILQVMPLKMQQRLVDLLEELDNIVGSCSEIMEVMPDHFTLTAKTGNNRFARDVLTEYRRPHDATIALGKRINPNFPYGEGMGTSAEQDLLDYLKDVVGVYPDEVDMTACDRDIPKLIQAVKSEAVEEVVTDYTNQHK